MVIQTSGLFRWPTTASCRLGRRSKTCTFGAVAMSLLHSVANTKTMRCEQQPTILGPLAHSARDGAPQQTYREHVGNVCRYSALFASDAVVFSPKWRKPFLAAVERAAAYHDLGKLDELFQDILRDNRKNKLGYNHVEAGTAHLLRLKQFEAAFAAYAHHIGLPSFPEEKAKIANDLNLAFRDTRDLVGLDETSWQRTED